MNINVIKDYITKLRNLKDPDVNNNLDCRCCAKHQLRRNVVHACIGSIDKSGEPENECRCNCRQEIRIELRQLHPGCDVCDECNDNYECDSEEENDIEQKSDEENLKFVRQLLGYPIEFDTAQKLYFPNGKKGGTILRFPYVTQWDGKKFIVK